MEWTCMSLNIKLLRVAGAWPRMTALHTAREKIYASYSAIIVSLYFIYVVIQLYGLTVYYSTWTNLDAAIEDFLVVMTGLLGFIKMVLVMKSQRPLQQLIDYLNNDLNQRQLTTEEDRRVLSSCIRHERRVTKTYLTFAHTITVLYLSSSVIRILRLRSKNIPLGTAALPLKYPFQVAKSAWFPFLYVHQFIIMLVIGQTGTVTDCFFACLVYYFCGHFRVIHNKLIAEERSEVSKEVIEYHKEVLSCVDRIQEIYETFLTMQLSLTAFLICLAVFQITQIEDIRPLHYVKCFIYLSIKMWQLLMYCWYGQEVTFRSCEVSTAVYQTPWYTQLSKETASRLIMVLERSQKPVVMTAGLFFNLSLKTFRAVINAAYTCFTLINIIQSQ